MGKKAVVGGSALDEALAAINDNFGPGTVIKMSEGVDTQIEVVPSGILSLDIALGIGGYPRGRIIECLGVEASGKSTVSLHAIREVQRRGGLCLLVDCEFSFDAGYAAALGVDVDSLLVSQPDNAEQAIEVIVRLVNTGEVALVVLDSVAALSPRAELEGEAGDAHVGLIARLMSQSMRRLQGPISKTGTILFLINQYRTNIGQQWGNPNVPTGGKAIRYAASIRMDVSRKETLKPGDEALANTTRCKIIKNKMSSPYTECLFDIEFGKGASREGCVLDLGSQPQIGLIKKSGAWFTYGDTQLGQGRDKSKTFLNQNPDICDEIEKKVREHYGLVS